MRIDRRLILLSVAALALASSLSSAQTAEKKVDLPDLVLGRADAPIVIEEYASLTCSHCAAFHNNVLPGLKTDYIATGKVRFIYRDFPLDELAVAAAMMARCVADNRENVLRVLYASQDTWLAKGTNPLENLYTFGETFGMTRQSMEGCLSNADLFNAIVADRDKFEKVVNVEGTPTFVINGRKFEGAPTTAGFDAVLKPLVK